MKELYRQQKFQTYDIAFLIDCQISKCIRQEKLAIQTNISYEYLEYQFTRIPTTREYHQDTNDYFEQVSAELHPIMCKSARTEISTTVRRRAVRETGVSWHHENPINDLPDSIEHHCTRGV